MRLVLLSGPMSGRIVVGAIEEVRSIREAHRVRRAVVDVGKCHLSIVFGGYDVVVAGSLVPVALPGARVVDARTGDLVKIRPRRYLGVLSSGMLCSVVELGWSEDGPDEVPLLREGRPGDALPALSEPADVLTAASLARHLAYRRGDSAAVAAWPSTADADAGPPTAPLRAAELLAPLPRRQHRLRAAARRLVGV